MATASCLILSRVSFWSIIDSTSAEKSVLYLEAAMRILLYWVASRGSLSCFGLQMNSRTSSAQADPPRDCVSSLLASSQKRHTKTARTRAAMSDTVLEHLATLIACRCEFLDF